MARGFEACVKRGIKRLDLLQPGWRSRVDRTRLEIQSPQYCILGQVFGGFLDGLQALQISLYDAWYYGFVGSVEFEHYATLLDETWRENL